MIQVRAGDLIPAKIYLFRSWVPLDFLADFGADAAIHVYAYPDSVVDPEERIELKAELVQPNLVTFTVEKADDTGALAAGNYGIIVQVDDDATEPTLSEFFPANGSELLIVGTPA